MQKINIGIIGCGNISSIYFQNLKEMFVNTTVYGCADINAEAAAKASEQWNVPVFSVEELLACKEVDIILNITTPQSHYDVCQRALNAGKHVYVEKPLALTLENGKELVALAKEKNLMLGCAPDTFLGAGIQTCRKLIDDGFIGNPIGATAFMLCHGHESWHPAPAFYYKTGGGPMFDMGPYYLTALVNLMGQVNEVTSMTAKTFSQRTITSQPQFGEIIDVEVPTHVNGILRFSNGAIGNIITSFDVWSSTLPRIEIYGTSGTLVVPDPNTFGGPVLLSTLDGSGFKEIPLTHTYAENSRGLGLSDMAQCVIDHTCHNRASGEMANHVLEIMCAMNIANDSGNTYRMTTQFERTAPLKTNLIKGTVK